MKINNAPNFQPVKLQSKQPQPQAPKPPSDGFSKGHQLMEGIKRKAGAMSSVIAGTAIGAGVTALATTALSTGWAAVVPATLLAGVAGAAIGLYRSRDEKGDFAMVGRMLSAGLHGAGGLAGGLIGKASVLGLAAGGTGMGIAAGVGATAVAGLALAYGTVKLVEMFRWKG
ncbi:MAG: hypothetical protein U0931_21995 [Vulcanimicrobiota bacterium]